MKAGRRGGQSARIVRRPCPRARRRLHTHHLSQIPAPSVAGCPPDGFDVIVFRRKPVPTDWQNASRSYDREQVSSARKAAEALFKPQRPFEEHGVPDVGPTTSSTEEGPGRTPRVFAMPQAPHVKPLPDDRHELPAPAPAPKKQRARAKRRSTAVPASHHARIRTLTTHGMSLEQVAEHYGVGVGEIERILAPKR
jgi:hypothetical protein